MRMGLKVEDTPLRNRVGLRSNSVTVTGTAQNGRIMVTERIMALGGRVGRDLRVGMDKANTHRWRTATGAITVGAKLQIDVVQTQRVLVETNGVEVTAGVLLGMNLGLLRS